MYSSGLTETSHVPHFTLPHNPRKHHSVLYFSIQSCSIGFCFVLFFHSPLQTRGILQESSFWALKGKTEEFAELGERPIPRKETKSPGEKETDCLPIGCWWNPSMQRRATGKITKQRAPWRPWLHSWPWVSESSELLIRVPELSFQELCKAKDELGRMKGEAWIKEGRREVISCWRERWAEGRHRARWK